MSFWNRFTQMLQSGLRKLQAATQRFMYGRYGADQLSLHMLLAGIFLYLISLFTRSYVFSLISSALYIFTAFRMLSRNTAKRAQENSRYLGFLNRIGLKGRQARLRFQNRKEYKYFRCPSCHAILRLKRGSGQVHVTCGKCKHQFDQKA